MEDLIRHSELADTLIEAKEKLPDLLKETIEDPKMSKVKAVFSHYIYIRGLLKEFGELDRRINSVTDLSIDRKELCEAANEMLCTYNVIRNNSIRETKYSIDTTINKLRKTAVTLLKREEEKNIAKANRDRAMDDRQKNAENAENAQRDSDEVFDKFSSYEFRLAAYREEYIEMIKYLNELLKIEMNDPDVDDMEYDPCKNKAIMKIDRELAKERARIQLEYYGEDIEKSVTTSEVKSIQSPEDSDKRNADSFRQRIENEQNRKKPYSGVFADKQIAVLSDNKSNAVKGNLGNPFVHEDGR